MILRQLALDGLHQRPGELAVPQAARRWAAGSLSGPAGRVLEEAAFCIDQLTEQIEAGGRWSHRGGLTLRLADLLAQQRTGYPDGQRLQQRGAALLKHSKFVGAACVRQGHIGRMAPGQPGVGDAAGNAGDAGQNSRSSTQ